MAQPRMIERVWRVFIVGVLLLLGRPGHADTAEIEWTDCPLSQPAPSAARMDCGWLSTGATLEDQPVRLRVVVLRARPDTRDRTPVIYLPGGPGDSAGLDAHGLLVWQRWQQAAGWPHDVVLSDPRGTGESTPRPRCGSASRRHDLGPIMRQRAGDEASEFTEQALSRADCYRALGRRTADALGPAAQIQDIDALVSALDADQVTLWGVSYGTRIARLYANRHPNRIRALVLDSLFPFTRDDLLSMPTQLADAIATLDSWCGEQAAHCRDLAASPSVTLSGLLNRYETAAPTLITADRLGRVRTFRVTPYRLLLMVLLAGYDATSRADTIQRLELAHDGRANALWPLVTRLERQSADPAKSDAVFWSTRCALQAGVPDRQQWSETLARYPVVARHVRRARAAPVCDIWQVTRVGPPSEHALSLPVLVLSGAQDPATPPRWARAFVSAHPSVRYVLVAGGGHAVTLGARCAQRAVAAFLADPKLARPADCDRDVAAE